MLKFFKTLPQIFYARSFYADLVLRGKGIGLRYIFLLAVLYVCLVMASFFSGPVSVEVMRNDIDAVFAQFPDVSIKDQKLSINVPSPHMVKVPSAGRPGYIVFNTAPREKDAREIAAEMEKTDILALVTSDFIALPKEAISATKEPRKVSLYDISELTGATKNTIAMTHEDWMTISNKVKKWILPFSSVLFLFKGFIDSFLVVLFQSFIVMLGGFIFATKPKWATSMRLAAVATIPVAVLRILIVPFHMNLSILAGLLMALTIAVFGLTVADKEAKATPKV